jgi:hypothetical protein
MNNKYIYSTYGMHEYYDLKTDPNEMNNMININSNVKSELKNILDPWIKKFTTEIIHRERKNQLKLSINKVRNKIRTKN